MAAALVPLQNITLGSSQATITFANIPTTGYRDLVLVGSMTGTATADLRARFNSDASANFPFVYMSGNGTSTYSGSVATDWSFALNGAFARMGTSDRLQTNTSILDYSATDKHKTVLSRGSAAGSGVSAMSGRWASTSAVTTILLWPDSGSFAAGSTFALYGVVA